MSGLIFLVMSYPSWRFIRWRESLMEYPPAPWLAITGFGIVALFGVFLIAQALWLKRR